MRAELFLSHGIQIKITVFHKDDSSTNYHIKTYSPSCKIVQIIEHGKLLTNVKCYFPILPCLIETEILNNSLLYLKGFYHQGIYTLNK